MGRLTLTLSGLRRAQPLLGQALPSLPTRVPYSMLLVPFGALGVAAALFSFNRSSPMQMATLVAVVGTFVFTAHARAWVVVPMLLVDLSIASFWVTPLGMSLRFAVTFGALLLLLPILVRVRHTFLDDPAIRRVLVPTVCFIVGATVINLLFSELGYVVKYLRYQIVSALVLVLVIAAVRDREALKAISLAMFAMVVASALVAVGQRIGGPLAWYVTNSGRVPIDAGARALGLTDSPVTFANTLVSVGVPALGFLISRWSSRLHGRTWLLLGTLLTMVGVYLTLTRSALISVAAGTVTIMALVDGRRRLHMLALLTACVGMAGLLLAVGVTDQRLASSADEDTSTASHVALGHVALAMALDRPLLGIGHEHFEAVSHAYEAEALTGLNGNAAYASSRAVGVYRPHNDFLEVWTSWGLFGLLAFLTIFVGTLHNCIIARRSSDPLIYGLAIGCAGGTVAYAVGSAFHNYLDSSVALWCFAGLSAVLVAQSEPATARLAALRRRPDRWSAPRQLRAGLARA